MSKSIDESGKRYGKLFVVSISDKVDKKQAKYFNCKCDCGKSVVICGQWLRCGNTTSCGCQRHINKRINSGIDIESREYKIYHDMKKRCYNPRSPAWRHYGGRGIIVCERWLKDFKNFLMDMGNSPSSEYTLDRKNNDGHYEPSNCRWATQQEQIYNRRVTVWLLVNGEKYLIKDLCKLLKITKGTFSNMYYQQKLSGQQIYDRLSVTCLSSC